MSTCFFISFFMDWVYKATILVFRDSFQINVMRQWIQLYNTPPPCFNNSAVTESLPGALLLFNKSITSFISFSDGLSMFSFAVWSGMSFKSVPFSLLRSSQNIPSIIPVFQFHQYVSFFQTGMVSWFEFNHLRSCIFVAFPR